MASAASTTFEDRDAAPKRVILIVEDEVIIRSVVSEYLRESDFLVIEAANVAEAVAVLSTQSHMCARTTRIAPRDRVRTAHGRGCGSPPQAVARSHQTKSWPSCVSRRTSIHSDRSNSG